MTSVNIPLIALDTNDNDIIASDPKLNLVLSRSIVHALKTSGFLLITSPHVPIALQQNVLQVTRDIFLDKNNDNDNTLPKTQNPSSSSSSIWSENDTTSNSNKRSPIKIVTHPTDPKQYIMLESPSILLKNNNSNDNGDNSTTSSSSDDIIFTPFQHQTLQTYWNALELVKRQLLKCIAIGLELPDSQFFVRLHQKNQSALRLLSYPPLPLLPKQDEEQEKQGWSEPKNDNPGQPQPQKQAPPPLPNLQIRCKPHSDYGSITILLTDGVPGLQALIDDTWALVPHVPGALVVNIGSLLSDWTHGELVATLHRVIVVEPSHDEAPPLLLHQKENNTSEEEEEEEDAPVKAQPAEITMTTTPTTTTLTTTTTTTRNRTRISLAFFADPDPDVAVQLKLQKDSSKVDHSHNTDNNTSEEIQEVMEKMKDCTPTTTTMSVADYIQWRSGGGTKDVQRSGIAYSTEHEESRAKRGNDEHRNIQKK
jgi:isopenicillin N synthase-like dioxygenase